MKIPGYDKWKTTPPEPSTYCDCCGSSSNMSSAWAQNEEMVDWLAIQSPKIFVTFQEVGCFD